MSGSRVKLVKESLKYLVNLMTINDKLAIVSFTDTASIKLPLTEMTEIGKSNAIKAIDLLRARGGTNIYSGLSKGLELITQDYTSGERVASMILLSDGYDGGRNADTNFKNHINNMGKQNYVFTLHTLGYGETHDSILMKKISLIRDGGYFFIRHLSEVNSAILEIYGSLSTNFKVNVVLSITSAYKINDVMGRDEMHESNLISKTPSSFITKIIHFVYGKSYDFIVLVDIPKNIQPEAVVLKATASPLGLVAEYKWDNTFDPYAYEEYIRGISFTYFQKAYDDGPTKGKINMNNAISWIASNYDGIRDWKKEYEDVVNDLNNFNSYGRANLLSKLRELKSSKPGIHYNDENSYQRKIMDDYFNIDISGWEHYDITTEMTIQKKFK